MNEEIENYKLTLEYNSGWRMGFYAGLSIMGLFSMIIYLMIYLGGR